MRTESLLVFVVIGSSACSLLAPSDADLSGEWGAGGNPGSGDGGQSTGAGRANAGGRGGSTATTNGGRASGGADGSGAASGESPLGGTGPQGGDGNDGEGGMVVTGSGGAKASGGAGAGGKTGAGGVPVTAGGGKTSTGGTSAGLGGTTVTGAGGNIVVANGGAIGAAGGKTGAGGTGAGGTVMTGAGGAVSHCSPNPCVRGTCAEAGSTYKCTCPAGWGGATCAVGSCSNLSCPASAPCVVPTSSVVAVCYPSACVGSTGLCMAENADGSGAAIIIDGRNPDFNPLSGSNWRNRAKYFAYLDDNHGRYACVFPQLMESGTPLVIPLNTVRTKTSGFGQSNSWPNPPTCEYP